MEVADEVWAKYRWNPEQPSETAYILIGKRPPHPYSKVDHTKDLGSQEMQHMVHVVQILQSPLVIIEFGPQYLHSESWSILHTTWQSIGYSVVHIEMMKHSRLGGATSRKRAFVWFQKDSTISNRVFPRIPQPDLFTTPQRVMRDVVHPCGHSTNPSPIRAELVWRKRCGFSVGQPALIGYATIGDVVSSPRVELGCQGSLRQEEGIWSVLSIDHTGTAKFRKWDGSRTCVSTYPLEEFTRSIGGQQHPVYSIDGISTIIRARGEYPPSYTNFIWQPKARGGDIRCLSTEEI